MLGYRVVSLDATSIITSEHLHRSVSAAVFSVLGTQELHGMSLNPFTAKREKREEKVKEFQEMKMMELQQYENESKSLAMFERGKAKTTGGNPQLHATLHMLECMHPDIETKTLKKPTRNCTKLPAPVGENFLKACY